MTAFTSVATEAKSLQIPALFLKAWSDVEPDNPCWAIAKEHISRVGACWHLTQIILFECNLNSTPLYPNSHPLAYYMCRSGSLWQHDKQSSTDMLFSSECLWGLCVAPGLAGKCIPWSVSWVRPWVSSQVPSPAGPVNLQREILQVPKPTLLLQCFFNRGFVLAGSFCIRVFIFFFFFFFSSSHGAQLMHTI